MVMTGELKESIIMGLDEIAYEYEIDNEYRCLFAMIKKIVSDSVTPDKECGIAHNTTAMQIGYPKMYEDEKE